MSRRALFAALALALLALAAVPWIPRDPYAVSLLDFFTFDRLVLNREPAEPDPFAGGNYARRYRLTIVSYLTPGELHRKGQLLADFFRANLGVEIVPIYSANYDSLGELMLAGKAEIVWASPFLYMKLKERLDYTVVAKITERGRADYGGVLVVKRDAPYRTVEDLRGKRIAFVDPSSSSGFQLPNLYFTQRGIDPFTFFAETSFAGKHDLAVDDVLKGRADVAAVYDNILAMHSDLIRTAEIRVLADVGKVNQAPILVSNRLPAADIDRIRSLLLEAANRPGGRELLAALNAIDGFTGFVPATKEEYAY